MRVWCYNSVWNILESISYLRYKLNTSALERPAVNKPYWLLRILPSLEVKQLTGFWTPHRYSGVKAKHKQWCTKCRSNLKLRAVFQNEVSSSSFFIVSTNAFLSQLYTFCLNYTIHSAVSFTAIGITSHIFESTRFCLFLKSCCIWISSLWKVGLKMLWYVHRLHNSYFSSPCQRGTDVSLQLWD